jgi:hypothetical protein
MNLPIDGLVITGDSITYNGADLDQLSGKAQIELSVALARALSGEIKVICIDGIEQLSESNRQLFESAAADDEFEYFLTQVTDGELAISSKDSPAKVAEKQAPTKVKKVARKSDLF